MASAMMATPDHTFGPMMSTPGGSTRSVCVAYAGARTPIAMRMKGYRANENRLTLARDPICRKRMSGSMHTTAAKDMMNVRLTSKEAEVYCPKTVVTVSAMTEGLNMQMVGSHLLMK